MANTLIVILQSVLVLINYLILRESQIAFIDKDFSFLAELSFFLIHFLIWKSDRNFVYFDK